MGQSSGDVGVRWQSSSISSRARPSLHTAAAALEIRQCWFWIGRDNGRCCKRNKWDIEISVLFLAILSMLGRLLNWMCLNRIDVSVNSCPCLNCLWPRETVGRWHFFAMISCMLRQNHLLFSSVSSSLFYYPSLFFPSSLLFILLSFFSSQWPVRGEI